jgi:amidase
MELCDLSAVEQRRLIGSKTISPRELLESCLSRIDDVNPTLNAITATCIERARTEAVAAEAAVMAGTTLGRLHGLPIGIKDTFETAGLKTTYGSPIFADHVPTKDERVVAAVREAGAIVVGKTNVPEFAAGGNTTNSVYGPTRNPFDTGRICGGSSGGSAVALATSMLSLCTGSDTGGSLRIPAAMCGVVGFRVSPGLVPSERRLLGWSPLSVIGPLGRDVADAALLLDALIADDPRDPLSGKSCALDREETIDLSTLRVSYSEDLGFAPVDRRIRETFRDRISRVSSVFKRCERSDPAMEQADAVFEILRAVGFLATHQRRFHEAPELLGPNIVANVEQGLKYSAADVAWAHTEQTRIYRSFQQVFDDSDVFVAPTVGVPPFPVERLTVDEIDGMAMRTYFHWLAPTYGLTLTGHPCISIPSGLEPTGTPFGLQICGRRGSERFVLAVAQAVEHYLAHDPATARPKPDLARLAGRRSASGDDDASG